MQLTPFDLAVLAVLLLSGLMALARGAVREVLGLASWIGAIVIAFYAFDRVQPYARGLIAEPLIADAVALLAAFLIPLVLLRIVTTIVARSVDATALGPLDKLVGLGFGLLRGALLVCGAYLVLSYLLPEDRQPVWIREARLQPTVRQGALMIERALPERALERGQGAAELAREAIRRDPAVPGGVSTGGRQPLGTP